MSHDSEVIEAEVIEDIAQSTSRMLAIRREAVAGLIRPVAKPAEVLAAQEATRDLVRQALTEERDYGTIPGTNKPTLYKPGAERINAAFGCAAQYRIIEKEIDHDRPNRYVKRNWERHPSIRGKKVWTDEPGESQGLYRYVLSCQLVHRESGVVIGEGVGSCSTMESRYIDRPRDLENTVLKMAKKRAYVDATLTTFGLSEQFTQDVEDMDLGVRGESGNGHGNGGSSNGDAKAPSAPFSMTDKVGFGKYKNHEWGAVVRSDPDYVSWALTSVDKLTAEAKKLLAEALEDHDVKYGAEAVAEKNGKVPHAAEPTGAA